MLIQYLSLNWPHDNGWVAYDALQLLAYFISVFVAPLAPLTGLGMSPALSARLTPVSNVLHIQIAGAWPRGATYRTRLQTSQMDQWD